MKVADVRAKSDDELKEELLSLRKETFNIRFQAASGQLENTAQMRHVRRDIARVKTVLKERKSAPKA
ncbi:MAG: 50S ribosomal protein L29 [Magnetovibrio sp.]|nr:50S ribosomal protein L29 [Magnetovibrio sp.]|tara:strand:+ start:248 stop:448 length:201 start_codon:yes stop_codon:yes gene_type:complete